MADIFLRNDMIDLMRGKRVLFVGSSNTRAQYKDFLWLLNNNTLINNSVLCRKLELSCLGDKLLRRSELTKGRDYVEHRLYTNNCMEIEFLFVTRCFCPSLEDILDQIHKGEKKSPDVIIMNSCLWDLTRWGPKGAQQYKCNMLKLLQTLKRCLPSKTLFIWTTTPPTSKRITGGLIIKQIEFLQEMLKFEIIEANLYVSNLVASFGFDVLDLHHYLQFQILRRSSDGVHFMPQAVRFVTNLTLTHICLSWGRALPGNVQNRILSQAERRICVQVTPMAGARKRYREEENDPPGRNCKRPKIRPLETEGTPERHIDGFEMETALHLFGPHRVFEVIHRGPPDHEPPPPNPCDVGYPQPPPSYQDPSFRYPELPPRAPPRRRRNRKRNRQRKRQRKRKRETNNP